MSAATSTTALQIIGGNSKHFYGRNPTGEPLLVADHQGIINYQPTELVITARSGTRLSTLIEALAEKRQMLAFEPPSFSPAATLGGTIACGFSGPRRPYTGSARDFVLGCKMMNGKGEILSFGGEVMKNVAGYDVSRLLAGSLGTLGVILEVSLKVLPAPVYESTRCYDFAVDEAIRTMQKLAAQCQPLSGLCYDGQRLYCRLSGSEQSVLAAEKALGGERLAQDAEFWQQLKEQQLAFFARPESLWRLSVPSGIAEITLLGEWFYDWGGALRWLKSDISSSEIFAATQQAGGHACLFKGPADKDLVFQPLPAPLAALHKRLKQALDPYGILNPQRYYEAL